MQHVVSRKQLCLYRRRKFEIALNGALFLHGEVLEAYSHKRVHAERIRPDPFVAFIAGAVRTGIEPFQCAVDLFEKRRKTIRLFGVGYRIGQTSASVGQLGPDKVINMLSFNGRIRLTDGGDGFNGFCHTSMNAKRSCEVSPPWNSSPGVFLILE
jgi:hypothetical protein